MAEKYGFVYLMANPCMPHIYKIGCTERSPHQRMQELSASTSVPQEFEMLCYIEVCDPFAVEARFHKWLEKSRVSPNREFFRSKNLRWLAGIFRYFDDSIAFTDVGLDYVLYMCMKEFGWDDTELINPFEKQEEKSAETEEAQSHGDVGADDSGERRAA